MDGLSRAAGSGIPVKVGDKTFLVSPLTLDDIGSIETVILKDRTNPIIRVAEAKQYLDQEDYSRLLGQAYDDARKANRATPTELQEFLVSIEGRVYAFWLGVRHNHPEVSLEDLQERMSRLRQEDLEQIENQIDVGLGIDSLGNSTGGADSTTPPTPGKTGEAPSDGSLKSTESSPTKSES